MRNNKTYTDREIDNFHAHLDEKMETRFNTVDQKLDKIDTKVEYTNGKVKKIIIAMVLLAGIMIGQVMTNEEIIKFFINTIV